MKRLLIINKVLLKTPITLIFAILAALFYSNHLYSNSEHMINQYVRKNADVTEGGTYTIVNDNGSHDTALTIEGYAKQEGSYAEMSRVYVKGYPKILFLIPPKYIANCTLLTNKNKKLQIMCAGVFINAQHVTIYLLREVVDPYDKELLKREAEERREEQRLAAEEKREAQRLAAEQRDIEKKRKKSETISAFFQACKAGKSIEISKYLSDKSLVKADVDGNTALMVAVTANREIEIIKLLIKSGSSLSACDRQGRTPLMIAIDNNADMKIIDLLIKSGALIIHEDTESRSILMAAINGNYDLELIKALISGGAKVNSSTKSGVTPLMIAYESGDTLIANFLIRNDADIMARD